MPFKKHVFPGERETMKKRIQKNGIVIALAILVVIFFPRNIIRHDSYGVDDLWEVLGVSLILAGQVLRVSSRGYKAEQSRNGNSLVVSGPYAMVRNPMYLGIILIGLGVVLAILNPWVLLLFAGGFLLRYLYLFPKEEKLLSEAFGRQYNDYMSRVPRILPNPSFLMRNNIVSYLPIRLSWFRRELPGICIILGIVLLIESWEELASGNVRSAAWGILPQLIAIIVFILLVKYLAQKYERNANKSKNKK
jgi:protein-S-isoprenylcysteine O-methyltransferase Ste14